MSLVVHTQTETPLSAVKVAYLVCLEAAKKLSPNNNERKFEFETLQKLAYICHGYFLAFNKKGLISDPVLIGQNGPYFEDLTELFKSHKEGITHNSPVFASISKAEESDDVLGLIESVYSILVLEKEFPCNELDYYTKGTKNDWSIIANYASKYGDLILPTEVIQQRFDDEIKYEFLTSYDVSKFKESVA